MKQSWSELTPQARHSVKIFNLILEAYQWEDEQQTELNLDRGYAVYPHATRSTSNQTCRLEATMHTQVSMLSLTIIPHESHQPRIKLHFLYKDEPAPVLEKIVQAQHWIRPGQYFRFATSLLGLCEDVLAETDNHEIHTLSA